MLEESIECSPCKSVRKLKCSRRKKNVEKAPDILQERRPNQILKKLYFDSEEECSEDRPLKNFDPYKTKAFSSISKKINQNTTSLKTLGLLNCGIKSGEGNGSVSQEISDAEITESELLKCCQEADAMLQQSPNQRLCLVNSILRDFGLSPYNDNAVPKFWEYSPEFVLKSKPRLTYSSKKYKSKFYNCNKRLHFVDGCPGIDDDSYPAQEKSLHVDDPNTTFIVPDATETLCENLLNLSAFFSQPPTSPIFNESPKQTTDFSEILKRVSDIQDECLALQKIGDNIFKSSFDSSENFHGFSEAGSIQEVHDTEINASQCSQFDNWDKEGCDIFALIKTPPKNYENNNRIGFKTASSKEIIISEAAKCKAALLIKNLPEIVPKQNLMMSDNVHTDCPSASKTPNDYKNGFTTAAFNQINISSESKIKEANLIMNLPQIRPKENLEQYNDPPTTSKSALQQNREYVKRYASLESDSLSNKDNCFGSGFQTAKGRVIKPTAKALKSIQNLLKDFQSDCEPIDTNYLESLKKSINNKHQNIETTKPNPVLKTEEDVLAEIVFSEWPLEEELKIKSSQKYMPEACGISDLREKKPENNENDMRPKNTLHGLRDECINKSVTQIKITGFQTANGKSLKPSTAALKTIETFLKEFQSECDLICSDLAKKEERPPMKVSKSNEENLKESTSLNLMTRSRSNLRNGKSTVNILSGTGHSQLTESQPIRSLDDNNVNPQRTNNTSKDKMIIDEWSSSKNIATSVNTPSINNNQNKSSSLMELSVKSPLNKSLTNSIISRRNLLSISKRKKNRVRVDIQKETLNTNLNTPIKTDSEAVGLQSPSTPCVASVFPATKCSTPCVPPEIDNDFKPIAWSDSSNIIATASDISPKLSVTDRLGTLRREFNFSPISPIVINSCRTSGLKRPRSMLKKD